MTEPLDPLPAGPPRPRLEVGRLWAGGVATAVVAALLALVGVLIVRAVLRIAVYAPAGAGAFGDSRTLVLCLGSAAAAIAATGLLHLLLVATPRPLTYFSWIVGLLTAAAAVIPFIYSAGLAVAFAQADHPCRRRRRHRQPALGRRGQRHQSDARPAGPVRGRRLPRVTLSCPRGPVHGARRCAGRGRARPARRCRPGRAGSPAPGPRSAAARRRRRPGSR